MDFANILNDIGFYLLSSDLFVLLAFIVGLFFYVFRLERDRALVVLVCSYVSLAVFDRMNLVEDVVGFDFKLNFVSQTLAFLLIIFLVSWIVMHSPLTSVFDQGPAGSWFQAFVLGFLQIGFTFSVIVSFLPLDRVGDLSIFMRAAFAGDIAQFSWLIFPILAIFFLDDK